MDRMMTHVYRLETQLNLLRERTQTIPSADQTVARRFN
jgi:hypothetical protein